MAIEALSDEVVSREVYDKRTQAYEEIIDSYRKEFQKALQTDAVMRDATAEERARVQQYIDSISTEAVQVVQCKDCRHANECHKNVQYTRNEQYTVTIGYSPIEWCSRGERREP